MEKYPEQQPQNDYVMTMMMIYKHFTLIYSIFKHIFKLNDNSRSLNKILYIIFYHIWETL